MKIRSTWGIVILLVLLITKVNSLTGSDLAASLGLLNSLPVLYGEVEPTDPTTYAPGTSYQFQVSVNDNNGADTIDTVFFEWDGVNATIASYSGINSTARQYTTTKTDLAAGTYTWKWYANDTDGEWGNVVSGDYTVSKNKSVLVLSNNTASVNTSGLVGYWRLESFNSTNGTADYSGWDNDGTCVAGKCPSVIGGRFGSGMEFDKVNDYIQIQDSTELSIFNDSVTVEAWVKPNSLTCDWDRIVEKDIYGISLTTNGGGYPCVAQWQIGNGTAYHSLDSTNYLIIGMWYHLVGVYDKNTNSIKIYFNGVEENSITYNKNFINTSDENLFIGSKKGIGNFFNGTIDEVRIWNRSLSSDEIKELYESKVTYGTQTTFTGNELNTRDSDVTYELFRNTTNVNATENGTAMTLNKGYHYYLFNTSGGQNYTRSAILLPLNITRQTPTCTLSFSPSSPISYPTQATATCHCTNTETGSNPKLWRDNIDVTSTENNTAIRLGVATYSYVCNSSATENYTSATDSSSYVVNKGKPTLVLFNDSYSVNTSGLVGYWRLESFNSTNGTQDYSGWDNDGTCIAGKCPNVIGGRFGSGVEFDGSDDYVNVDNQKLLSDNFTLSAWVYPKSNDNMGIVGYTDENGYRSAIILYDTSKVVLVRPYSTGNYGYRTFSGAYNINEWNYVVATYNGTIEKVYINGELKSFEETDWSLGLGIANVAYIGRNPHSTAQYFNGTIDEVKIYNRVLSASEIAELYQSHVIYDTTTLFSPLVNITDDNIQK